MVSGQTTQAAPDVARYRRDGFVAPVDIFSPRQIGGMRKAFDALEAVEGRERARSGFQGRHFDQRFVWEMATDRRLLDAMQALIGPDILLLSTHFFCKYPGGPHYVAWHQDVTYWGLEPARAHSAWIAIDDADLENGCMEVIPASHLDGVHPHGSDGGDANLLSVNQAIDPSRLHGGQAVPIELRAGQASVHDGRLVHASRPNRSARRRCGLTVRFVTPEVRQSRPTGIGGLWRPVVVRGRDHHGHFPRTPEPFPLAD